MTLGRLAKWHIVVVAGILIGIFEIQVLASIRHQSQTFDESVHIFAGYQYWKQRDFGANPEHPPLVKLIATLPLLFQGLPDIPPIVGTTKAANNNAATNLIYSQNFTNILFITRAAASLFGITLLVLAFLWTREIAGSAAALIVLFLLSFDPNLITHAGLVTTDMGLTCTSVAVIYSLHRFFKNPTWGRLGLTGLALGLALATKHSAILLPPIVFVLILCEWWVRRGDRGYTDVLKSPARWVLSTVTILSVAWIVLWSVYQFRFSARPDGYELEPKLEAYASTLRSPAQMQAILTARRLHLLPESYLWGLTDVSLATEGRVMFILGKVYPTGRWFFFPATFFMKSTVGVLLLLVLALLRGFKPKFTNVYLLIPSVFLIAVAMTSGLNLGFRHILPSLGFLTIFSGVSAWQFASRYRAGPSIIGLLLLAHVASSLRVFPNYLTYANELVGGPVAAHKFMTGSDVDWGQGLIQTQQYLSAHGITDCWFAYYVPMVDPSMFGIPCRRMTSGIGYLTGRPVSDFPGMITGTILVSANEAAGQAWGPDELNPYKQFYDRKPDDIIANSILVFHGAFDVSLASAMNHAVKAQRLARQKNWVEAEEEAQIGADLSPNSAEVNAVVCRVFRDAQKLNEARPYCDKTLALAGEHHPEYQFLRMPGVRLVARVTGAK